MSIINNLVFRLRLGNAVYKRLRMEKEIRAMWADLHPPGTKRRSKIVKQPFGQVLSQLKRRGYIPAEDYKLLDNEYKRLSNIIHGVS